MPRGGEQAGGETASGAQVAPDESDLRSGETYVGYAQTRGFASPGGQTEDAEAFYRVPATLRLNHWGLGGNWTVGGEFATLNGEAGRIVYRFHARDLHLVMGPPAPGQPVSGQAVRFRVTIDGAAPGADHGADTDAEGWGSLQDTRSEEHTSELQSLMRISYAVFCLKKKNELRSILLHHLHK